CLPARGGGRNRGARSERYHGNPLLDLSAPFPFADGPHAPERPRAHAPNRQIFPPPLRLDPSVFGRAFLLGLAPGAGQGRRAVGSTRKSRPTWLDHLVEGQTVRMGRGRFGGAVGLRRPLNQRLP